MKTVSVNIVMTYPVRWTRYQVLRDFVQNFYDAVGFEDWRRCFHYTYNNSVLTMWIDDISFNYEWLMHIGASTKTGRSIGFAGFFGEGFKIASLCAFRDMSWDVEMMSDDWHIDVTSIEQFIDGTPVTMLAYNISSVSKSSETKLLLKNISVNEFDLFKTIIDSFFCPDNPIMGDLLWQGEEGAVFLRSKNPLDRNLPVTKEYGRKGAVFCGYQMMGTNPFNLVVCLHSFRKEDRERKALYSFQVIDVFKSVCSYVDPECAMIMLEKMRRYWNSYPKSDHDVDSWSKTINILIRRVYHSPEVMRLFVEKYDNLLYLKRISSIREKNRRWQARTWLRQQDRKYILVKDTFQLFGYPSIEEECERHGGFVIDDNVDSFQEQCFIVLEEVCSTIFQSFFAIESVPERKIITNSRAVYRGMAVVYKKKEHLINKMGLKIRYDIGKIYLKSEVLKAERYYDALSTYIHEMCHMFGGDASDSFSQALTITMGMLMENQEIVVNGKEKWTHIFETPDGMPVTPEPSPDSSRKTGT